jgi:hypothetical protein
MISADEAYTETLKILEPIETIDQVIALDNAIKDAASKGYFVIVSSPLKANLAEKLSIEFEEMGYMTTVVNSARQTESGEALCNIIISWRHRPVPNSRVIQPEEC